MRRAGAITIALLVGSVVSGWAQDMIFADNFEYGPDRGCMWWSMVEGGGQTCEMVISLEPGEAVTMTLMYIPPGAFLMGSPVGERGRYDREDLHEVTLTPGYYVGKYEVTQGQWAAVMGSWTNTCGSSGVGADYPVNCVSWNDVAGDGGFVETLNAYLASMAQPTGFRLPTEAEWERAARAGNQYRFSHGDVLECDDYTGACPAHDVYMWWGGSQPYTADAHPVGSRQANGYGLYDMHGNEWEWVQDWYQDYLGTSPATDPTGPEPGSYRVIRGGDWYGYAQFCRSASRSHYDPTSRHSGVGFRLALWATTAPRSSRSPSTGLETARRRVQVGEHAEALDHMVGALDTAKEIRRALAAEVASLR